MLEDFAPEAVREIRARLDSVRQQGVHIGFAIESGSRAWGFPSPDSDYDCRFVYIRPVADHLALEVPRDVIEFPIVGDIDTGGWDLKKALILALKGNAVIVEWLKSPLVYEEEPGFRARLSEVLDRIVDPGKVSAHYFGLLQRHASQQREEAVKLKKLLYALRPAVALEWMRQRGFSLLPPMNLEEMIGQTVLPERVVDAIAELVAAKKVTRELGEGPIPSVIFDFIVDVDRWYRALPSSPRLLDLEAVETIAGDYYRNEVLRSR